ncbi:MAG: gliding motility-associated C-terminal domain-containing protein [Brumimicrobium sp.]
MKKFTTILFFLIGFISINAQTTINITDPSYDQSNPIICSDFDDPTTENFFDDGGSAGDYSANFNDTITICPDLPNGPKITATFGGGSFNWDVDGTDTLYVFDGPDVTSPLLGAYNSDTDPTGFNHTSSFNNNPSGCLTFVFVSDGSNESSGWTANIECVSPPQPIGPHIEAYVNNGTQDELNPADTGYVDICPGDSVLLVANPDLLYSFENTGNGYSQDVDDLDYEWELSDGTIGPNNDSMWFSPPSNNGYFVNLTITDDFPQSVQMACKIRVSQPPGFSGVQPLDDTVCFNQETTLVGGVSASDTVGINIPGGSFEAGGSFAGLTALPDGSGVNYSTDINMSGFPAGSTFSNASDLQDICVEIEHSYLGDLEMWLECPNGTTVALFDAFNGGFLPGGGFTAGGTFLGEPIDMNTGTPGNGYEYCFSEINSTWSDFPTEFAAGNTVALTNPPAPSAGNSMNPNGVYEPEGNFSDFNGCPLNGTWSLNVRDNIGIDDGFIFEWGLYFDPSLFPNNETYQNTIDDAYWSPDPTITSATSNDTLITVLPDTVGDFEYTFNIEDDFGCHYDTVVSIHVLDTVATISSLDTTIVCFTDSVPLWTEASGLDPFTYLWDSGQTNETAYYSALENGYFEYYVEVTDACDVTTIDTASITVNQTLQVDTMLQFPASCGEEDGAVSGQGSGFTGSPDYEWIGPGANSTENEDATVWDELSTGWYYFSIEDDVCQVNDSIFLEEDPPPTADFTADPTLGTPPLTVNFTNESDDADTYDWNFGNGDSITVNDLSDQSSVYNDEGVFTVTLVVTDGSCTDEATEEIIVILEYPLHYDMPNVFTPNNDDSNDEFTLNTENAESLDIVIVNRWGNVVFESSDVDAAWNGRVNNSGQECEDGTYFYKFTITGEDGKEIEEHGFVQLVRE